MPLNDRRTPCSRWGRRSRKTHCAQQHPLASELQTRSLWISPTERDRARNPKGLCSQGHGQTGWAASVAPTHIPMGARSSCHQATVGVVRHRVKCLRWGPTGTSVCLSVCLALELATRRQVRTLSGNPGHCQAPCFCPDLSPALAHQGQTGTGPLPYPTARAQSSKAGRVGASLGPRQCHSHTLPPQHKAPRTHYPPGRQPQSSLWPRTKCSHHN